MSEDAVVFWCTVALGIASYFFAEPAKSVEPTSAVIYTSEAANTSARARAICPKGMRVRATMSVSTWNSGGWPLWRVVCIGERHGE